MPRKLIIDTDPGVDDVLAILFALASPEVEIPLITNVFGNTHAPQTLQNLLKVYHVLQQELEVGGRERYNLRKTVVALGEDGPIGGEKHVATYFHGHDGLSNISETHPEFTAPPSPYLEVTDKSAYRAILDLLASEPEGTVSIVALGPPWALREDPAIFARVQEVIWMGGALDVPGNTSPVSEFNCFADPYAAAALIDAAKAGMFRFVFAPLDITTPHMIPFRDLLHPALADVGIDPVSVPPPTPLQRFTTAFLLRVRGLQAKFGLPDAMEMHDPVALWYAIAGGAGFEVTGREFAVERVGELTRGMCVVDKRGGDSHGKKRTEDDELLRQDIPAPQIEPELGPKEGETTAGGEKAKPEDYLPLAMSRTPGSEVLRRELLARVFGKIVDQ